MRNMIKTNKKLIALLLCLTVMSCQKKADDSTTTVDSTAEAAQHAADVMASVDESGGSTSGALTQNNPLEGYQKTYARLAHEDLNSTQVLFNTLLPRAVATNCSATTFSSCSSFQKVRDFSGCSLTTAGGSMSGNVTLTFSGTGASSCTIPAATDAVTRAPNYSITGLRGATFTVSGSGQTLTRTGATTFTLANSTGIRRVFTNSKGSTVLDVTTTIATSSPINVTGNSRTGRTISGGPIAVKDNLTNLTCNLSPNSVAWNSSTCNCPTAGSLSGSCSDSQTMTLTFSTTCGQATITKGTTTNSTLTLDRCQ